MGLGRAAGGAVAIRGHRDAASGLAGLLVQDPRSVLGRDGPAHVFDGIDGTVTRLGGVTRRPRFDRWPPWSASATPTGHTDVVRGPEGS